MTDISRESTNVERIGKVYEEQKSDITELKQPLLGFLFFGFVGLVCFNFFLQSLMFFDSSLSTGFSDYANILYGLSNNCGQLLVIFFGPKFPFSRRIYYSTIALAVILVAYPILAVSSTNSSVGMSFGLLLTSGLGFFNAIIQSAGFGLAGICSPQTMNYFSLGQAVAGLAPFPLMLTTRAVFLAAGVSDEAPPSGGPSDLDTACNVTTMTLAAVVTLLMLPFYRFSLSQSPIVKRALADLDTMKHSTLVQHRSTIAIIKDTLPLALSVWFVLYVTFIVFPSQIFKWEPSLGSYPKMLPFASLIIYIFQVFDVVGRYVVNVFKLSRKQTKVSSLLRAILVPLFFLATYDISFFSSDFTRMILMALLAMTNGLTLSWCMIHGPSQVHKDEMDVASYTMSFFLVNGIFFGSLTSMAIVKIMAATA
jgi:hypothetical protein